MANILESNVVSYVCACGHLNPITKLFFCRHCLKPRCGFCVCHEVDSHFCYNCLENIPSGEAKLKKYRCNKCFECPSCQHTLSSRATTVQLPRDGDVKTEKGDKAETSATEGGGIKETTKVSARKMYYLSCLACRWTSRDVGLSDQTNAAGNWPEIEYAHSTRFSKLMEYYQDTVIVDKQEKQDYSRRMTPKKHKFGSLTDRTGLTASMVRRQMGWSEKLTIKKNPIISPSEASEDVDELPKDIFTQPINLKSVTTLKQRLQNPALQPSSVNNLYPQHKSISIKRSLRCKQCQHNVLKPEFNPPSIKYRIQLYASAHMPDVRLIKSQPIVFGSSDTFTIHLRLTNPTLHDMTITIMDLPTADEEDLIISELKSSFEKSLNASSTVTTTSGSAPSSLTSLPLSRQQSIIAEELRSVGDRVNATVIIPDSSFILNYRDDAAEFDDDDQVKKEELKFILWRKANKVAIDLNVRPQTNLLKVGDDVVAGFTMQYTYVNTVVGSTAASSTSSSDKKERHALSVRVYVRLGQVQPK
ncbi:dynactin subunit 4 [Contarinia nasturtii]|uniref:dynactin subunit 4 n=1 Tax=Contarinia nasturtii TaxID=265458 RepID=UPI0012D4305C|nr:dynactin subunit 4 [Contarinia nasturtii]